MPSRKVLTNTPVKQCVRHPFASTVITPSSLAKKRKEHDPVAPYQPETNECDLFAGPEMQEKAERVEENDAGALSREVSMSQPSRQLASPALR